jgi:hypothetical protein
MALPPPAARAMLYVVIRLLSRATAAGDQGVRGASPDLHPLHGPLCLATPARLLATRPLGGSLLTSTPLAFLASV